MDNEIVYKAATNPVLAVRLAGGPGYPRPGYPEVLVFKKNIPALDIFTLQETVYDAIKTLDDRDRAVILARFGEETTLQEYGDRIGRTRERVRQLEARALRVLRSQVQDIIDKLREATEIMAEPGSCLDPDWINTTQAAKITGYSKEHIRHLCRTRRVTCQIHPLKRNQLQISAISLAAYVIEGQGDGRRTGEWKENDEQA